MKSKDIIPPNYSRRRARVVVPYERVLCMLLDRRKIKCILIIPYATRIPTEAKLLSVHTCYERDAFVFTLEHESFEPVKEGCCIPEIPVTWEAVELATKAPNNG